MLKPPILKGKEDISRDGGFNMSLPTRLGFSCSRIIFSLG